MRFCQKCVRLLDQELPQCPYCGNKDDSPIDATFSQTGSTFTGDSFPASADDPFAGVGLPAPGENPFGQADFSASEALPAPETVLKQEVFVEPEVKQPIPAPRQEASIQKKAAPRPKPVKLPEPVVVEATEEPAATPKNKKQESRPISPVFKVVQLIFSFMYPFTAIFFIIFMLTRKNNEDKAWAFVLIFASVVLYILQWFF